MSIEKTFDAVSKSQANIILDYNDKLDIILANFNVKDIDADIDIKFSAVKTIEAGLGISTPSAMMELSQWLLQKKGLDLSNISSDIGIIEEDTQDKDNSSFMNEIVALSGSVDFSSVEDGFSVIEPSLKKVLNCSFCDDEITSFHIMCFSCGKPLHANCGLRNPSSKHAFCSEECLNGSSS